MFEVKVRIREMGDEQQGFFQDVAAAVLAALNSIGIMVEEIEVSRVVYSQKPEPVEA